MVVSLSLVLARRELRLREVYLPTPDIPVRWVATSELTDPTPFLEGGELLLTTGIEARDWDEEWEPYVRRLATRGVAAIGLGTGPGAGLTHRGVPAGLLRAARSASLAVVEVPEQTTFVAVSRAVAHLLDEGRAAEDTAFRRTQSHLVQASLRDADGRALLEHLARALPGACCLVGPHGRPVTGPEGEVTLLDLDRVARQVDRMRRHGGRAGASLVDEQAAVVVQPVGTAEPTQLYLVAATASRLTARQRDLVTTAVALAGLLESIRHERRDARRRLASRAFELLTAGDAESAAVVLAVAGDAVPDRVVLLSATGATPALGDAWEASERAGAICARTADGAEEDAGRTMGGASEALQRLEAVCDARAAERLAARWATSGLRVGVGPVVAAQEAGRSLRGAREAARRAVAGRALRWSELAGRGLLALVDPEAAADYGSTVLGPLNDEERGFLRALLARHGSRGRTAADLALHRNTVRARVTRIEAALGLSLDDPQARAELWLALQALRRDG